jgi:hypothetical protein
MGVDWLYRASKSFNRALDKREVELRTPTLFSPQIELIARTICGDVVQGMTCKEGDQLILRVVENRLVAQRDNCIVAEFTSPPNEEFDRIRQSCVEIAEVKSVSVLSNTVEVGICHE